MKEMGSSRDDPELMKEKKAPPTISIEIDTFWSFVLK